MEGHLSVSPSAYDESLRSPVAREPDRVCDETVFWETIRAPSPQSPIAGRSCLSFQRSRREQTDATSGDVDETDTTLERKTHIKLKSSARRFIRRLSSSDFDETDYSPEKTDGTPKRRSRRLYRKRSNKVKSQFSVSLEPPPEVVDLDDVDYAEQHAEELEHLREPVVSFWDSWRSRSNLANFMTRNHHFHVFIVGMVIVDVVIVLTELFLDLEVLTENECRSSSKCPLLRRNNASDPQDRECDFKPNNTECIYRGGKKRCLPPGSHHDTDPAHVLHYFGLAVLSFFVLEVTIKAWALGAKFFHHKLEVFDAMVVIVSFVLDLTIGGDTGDAVSLIVLLRLWRVTRILNGLTVAIEESEREKRHELKMKLHHVEEEVVELRELVHVLRKEVAEWRRRAGVPLTSTDVKNDTHVKITHLHLHSHPSNESTKEDPLVKAAAVWDRLASMSKAFRRTSSTTSNGTVPNGMSTNQANTMKNIPEVATGVPSDSSPLAKQQPLKEDATNIPSHYSPSAKQQPLEEDATNVPSHSSPSAKQQPLEEDATNIPSHSSPSAKQPLEEDATNVPSDSSPSTKQQPLEETMREMET